MWVHNLNPTLLKLGFLEIRWYGLVYIFGFFLSILWLFHLRKRGLIALSKDEIWDFVFYLMLGVLIGARLFEVFWTPELYLSDPINLFKIWQGGMSFHGGFVGIVTAAWLYCRKKKLPIWKMADYMSLPAMFALALGRIANFVNGELVGRVWNGSWCVIFPDYGSQCRHPSMIYAFLQRMAVFGWLSFLTFSKSLQSSFKPGFIFWNFVLWEGVGRIIVDFYREDILYFGFSLGQWFSLVMVIAAVIAFVKYYQEDWKNIFKSEK
ncbi:MAG: prolipoprotein diacylglyceryl transferase [Nanoarchaeota archaeon]